MVFNTIDEMLAFIRAKYPKAKIKEVECKSPRSWSGYGYYTYLPKAFEVTIPELTEKMMQEGTVLNRKTGCGEKVKKSENTLLIGVSNGGNYGCDKGTVSMCSRHLQCPPQGCYQVFRYDASSTHGYVFGTDIAEFYQNNRLVKEIFGCKR